MLRILKSLVFVAVLALPCFAARTTVTGTLTKANGDAYVGSFRVTWQTFMNAGGTTIQGGYLNVTLNGSGAFSVSLEPNVGANPVGTSYRIDFDNLRSATKASEYWVVGATSPTTQAVVRTIPPPTPSSIITTLPNLVSIGTITTGTWHGSVIDLPYGGTNQSSWTASRCVHVNSAGTALEVTATDCNVAGGNPAFSSITSGTNAVAAMVVGAGASLNPASTGVVNANFIQLSATTEGTCNSGNRFKVIPVAGGAGVADTFRVCTKDSSDTYAFRPLN